MKAWSHLKLRPTVLHPKTAADSSRKKSRHCEERFMVSEVEPSDEATSLREKGQTNLKLLNPSFLIPNLFPIVFLLFPILFFAPSVVWGAEFPNSVPNLHSLPTSNTTSQEKDNNSPIDKAAKKLLNDGKTDSGEEIKTMDEAKKALEELQDAEDGTEKKEEFNRRYKEAVLSGTSSDSSTSSAPAAQQTPASATPDGYSWDTGVSPEFEKWIGGSQQTSTDTQGASPAAQQTPADATSGGYPWDTGVSPELGKWTGADTDSQQTPADTPTAQQQQTPSASSPSPTTSDGKYFIEGSGVETKLTQYDDNGNRIASISPNKEGVFTTPEKFYGVDSQTGAVTESITVQKGDLYGTKSITTNLDGTKKATQSISNSKGDSVADLQRVNKTPYYYSKSTGELYKENSDGTFTKENKESLPAAAMKQKAAPGKGGGGGKGGGKGEQSQQQPQQSQGGGGGGSPQAPAGGGDQAAQQAAAAAQQAAAAAQQAEAEKAQAEQAKKEAQAAAEEAAANKQTQASTQNTSQTDAKIANLEEKIDEQNSTIAKLLETLGDKATGSSAVSTYNQVITSLKQKLKNEEISLDTYNQRLKDLATEAATAYNKEQITNDQLTSILANIKTAATDGATIASS